MIRLIHRLMGGTDFLAFSDETAVEYAEIHFAGSTPSATASGLVQKEILRTGHWPVIPTLGGTVKKPLTIIRNGKSDRDRGIIALSELVENFKKVGQRVQIPLTDDNEDHKNQLRLNTGFIESLEIVDKADGDSRLVAIMKFTEPDVRDKVLRGTYADVSCGIPWEFRSRGETFGATLEHVCITNRPFIDGLGDFLALSDGDDPVVREVSHFVAPPAPTPVPEPVPTPPQVKIVDPFGGLSIREVIEKAGEILSERQRAIYQIVDVKASGIVINDPEREESWRIPFKVEDGKLVASDEGWKPTEYQADAAALAPTVPVAPPEPNPEPPPPAPPAPVSSGDPIQDELETARRNRNLRAGVAASTSTTKEGTMPLTREELEALNLADMPEGQRAAFQKLIDESVTLSAQAREGTVAERIVELENMGFKEKPGALKLYRQIMLADDGGPAAVVLSDDGKKETKTALAILDDFIDAIKGAEGKVTFSDQAHLIPGDQKPPTTPEGEKKPVAERLAEAKAALAGVHGA
jgi:hypothetical protein